MFTGIIEMLGTVVNVEDISTNKTFLIRSSISSQLTVDQSLSHDGVCLTVEEVDVDLHRVTAVAETLSKTNIGGWKPGSIINLERCLPMNGRLDGHMVQGHVDTTAVCTGKTDQSGSWKYQFEFPSSFSNLVVEKGSICLNGISLTVFDVSENNFSVAIIPYTYENTNLRLVTSGMRVNIEFDIIGKYVSNMIKPLLERFSN